jgi:hypothetical protein
VPWRSASRGEPEMKRPSRGAVLSLNQGAQRRRISPHLFGQIHTAPGASILTGQSKYSVCWNGAPQPRESRLDPWLGRWWLLSQQDVIRL